MNNGYLPMYIHKRLTFEIDLRMRAEIVIQKRSLHNGVIRHVCFQLSELVWTGLCAFSRKNISYCHLHFMRMIAYQCLWESMRVLLHLTIIVIHLTTYKIIKKNVKLSHRGGGGSTQTKHIQFKDFKNSRESYTCTIFIIFWQWIAYQTHLCHLWVNILLNNENTPLCDHLSIAETGWPIVKLEVSNKCPPLTESGLTLRFSFYNVLCQTLIFFLSKHVIPMPTKWTNHVIASTSCVPSIFRLSHQVLMTIKKLGVYWPTRSVNNLFRIYI